MKSRLGETLVSLLGMAGLLAWLLLFAAGLSINSKPYRDRIAQGASGGEGAGPAASPPAGLHLSDLAMTTALYTPLNAALLTILAALIGGCTSFLTFSRGAGDGAPAGTGASPRSLVFLTEVPFASMLRGFLVYVATIAGIYITTEDPFNATTSAQYVRVVGLLSFIGFVVGYDPNRVAEVIAKLPGASTPAAGGGAPARAQSPAEPGPGG